MTEPNSSWNSAIARVSGHKLLFIGSSCMPGNSQKGNTEQGTRRTHNIAISGGFQDLARQSHGCPDPVMATALRRWRDHWRSVPITASWILSAYLERELWLKYFYPVSISNLPRLHQKSFLPLGDCALLVLHLSLVAGLHCCLQLLASWTSAGSASVHADSLNTASRAWGSCKPSIEWIKHILVLPHHHL